LKYELGICRIPIWYDVKLLVAAWLVLPQFKGAAYLYERFVRDHIRKYVTEKEHQSVHHHPPPPPEKQQQNKKLSPSGSKTKKKFVDFILPKKVSSLINYIQLRFSFY
jgi:receptor expression-enhancing protein 5/6